MKTNIVMPLKLIGGLTLAAGCMLAQSAAKSDSSAGVVLRGKQTIWPAHKLRPVVLPDGRMLVSVARKAARIARITFTVVKTYLRRLIPVG